MTIVNAGCIRTAVGEAETDHRNIALILLGILVGAMPVHTKGSLPALQYDLYDEHERNATRSYSGIARGTHIQR